VTSLRFAVLAILLSFMTAGCTSSRSPDNVGATSPTQGKALDVTLRPGRLGTLQLGMKAESAINLGYIRKIEKDQCGTTYEFSEVARKRLPGERSSWAEFRFGDPDDLDWIVIQSPTPRTSEGAGVGTTLQQLESLYGQRLLRVGPPLSDPTAPGDLAIFEDGAALVFGTGETNSVTYVQIADGGSPESLERSSDGC
jgi:hypothetical protein